MEMKRNWKTHTLLAALIVSLGASSVGRNLLGQDPHPQGATVATIISFGDEYTSTVELYDAKITLLEIVRGTKAWSMLKEASAANRTAPDGSEYILARIRFEFSARGAPGDKSYVLSEEQFTSFASDGRDYRPAEIEPPAPRLNKMLHSRESSEGWLVFLVEQGDRKPFMVFRENVQNLLRSGAGTRFQLY
jgi:hypothetical protein